MLDELHLSEVVVPLLVVQEVVVVLEVVVVQVERDLAGVAPNA